MASEKATGSLTSFRVIIVGAGTFKRRATEKGTSITVVRSLTWMSAGLAGLSTAVALARRGHSVLVLESTSEPIQPRLVGPEAEDLHTTAEGVLQLNDEACVALDGIELRNWATGDLVTKTAANPTGKQNAIHHGDLQLALLSRAQTFPNVEIQMNARVVDIDIEATSVTTSTGKQHTPDIIIAADGVRSTIKPYVCPPEAAKAVPTDDAAYRFTLPRQLLELQSTSDDHSGPDQDALLRLIRRPWASRWDGPGKHVIVYPIRNHQLLNIVFIHPDRDGQAEESWTSMVDKGHVAEDFRGWDPRLQKLIELAPQKVANFRLFVHEVCPVWHKAHTVLLGDACHAMLPYLGQGVAQAVEDATALTTVLSLIGSTSQIPLALQAFETSRKERVAEIQAATYHAQMNLHLKDAEAQRIRDDERKAAGERSENSDVVQMQQQYWVWDAGEVAVRVLRELLVEEKYE